MSPPNLVYSLLQMVDLVLRLFYVLYSILSCYSAYQQVLGVLSFTCSSLTYHAFWLVRAQRPCDPHIHLLAIDKYEHRSSKQLLSCWFVFYLLVEALYSQSFSANLTSNNYSCTMNQLGHIYHSTVTKRTFYHFKTYMLPSKSDPIN